MSDYMPWGKGKGRRKGRGMGFGQGYGRGQGGFGRRGGGGYGRGGPPWGVPGQSFMPQSIPVQPPPPNAVRVVVPVDDATGLDSRVSMVFARAPYLLVIDIVNGSVVNVQPVPNPYMNVGGGAGRWVSEWILSIGARIVIAPSVGPNVMGMLRQSGIAIYNIPPGTRVIDALRSLGLIR